MLKKIKTLTAVILTFHLSTFGQVFKNDIKFDKSILHAKLVGSSESLDMYAATNKSGNPQKDLPIFALTYYTNMTYESAKGYIEHHKSSLIKDHKTIKTEKTTDTVMNGFRYYISTMTTSENVSKKEDQLVYGFALKDNSAAFFLGSTSGSNKYVTKLQETVFSIKL